MADITVPAGSSVIAGRPAPVIEAATTPDKVWFIHGNNDRDISVQMNGSTVYLSNNQYDKIRQAIIDTAGAAFPSIDDSTRLAMVGTNENGQPLYPIRP